MKRVVIFSRVSKFDMDLSRQINQLKTICEKNNYEIIEDFSEKISGAKEVDERLVFKQFLNFVLDKKNKIDGVLVHEISRLGRKISVTAKAIEELHDANIWIYSLKENVYTLNANGSVNTNALLLINIMQAIAENERDSLIYRVNSGIKQSIQKGNSFGGVCPYGYKRENKKFVIVEEEANIIKKVFELYTEKNMGSLQIAKYLNEKNIQTRFQTIGKTFKLKNTIVSPENMKWSDTMVIRMLKQKLYIGIRSHTNNRTKINTEIEIPECKIIENDIFLKAQEILKNNYNKKGINTKFEYIIDNGIIKCGECGKSYYPHKRLNKKDNTYKCLSKRYDYKENSKCDNNTINIDKLSNIVWKYVRNTKELLKQLEENIKNNTFQNTLIQKEEELKEKLRLLANVLKKENKLLDLYLNENISKEVYQQKNRNIQLEKNTIKYQTDRISNDIIELRKNIDNLTDLNFQLRTIKASRDNMKETIKNIIKSITIHRIKGDNLVYENDINTMIEIKSFASNNSTFIVIGQRSKSYSTLLENEFNRQTNEIIGEMKEIKKRTNKIPDIIKI